MPPSFSLGEPSGAASGAGKGSLASLLASRKRGMRPPKRKPRESGDGDGGMKLAVDADGEDDKLLPSAPPAEGGAALQTFLGSLMKSDKKRKREERKRAEREGGRRDVGIGRRAPPTPAADVAAVAAPPSPVPRPEDDEERQNQLPDPSDAFLDCPAAALPEAEGESKGRGKLKVAEVDRPLPCSWADGGRGARASPSSSYPRWLASEAEDASLPPFPRSPPRTLAEAGVRPKVAGNWRELVASDARARAERRTTGAGATPPPPTFGDFASEEQAALFGVLRTYRDVLFCSRPYPTEPIVSRSERAAAARSTPNDGGAAAASSTPTSPSRFRRDDLMDSYLLHVASHVAASAARIRRNNEAVAAAEAEARTSGGAAPPPPRDQGFARPKVLLLLPLRSVALRAVLRLASLLQRETRTDSIRKKQRFEEEFGASSDEEEDEGESDGDGGGEDKRRRRKRRGALSLKPRDHRALFSGNSDDHFRLGIRVTRGAVSLFSDFDESDVIVASPLGLATYLQSGGAGGDKRGGDKTSKTSNKERARLAASAADCLSSLEIVVVDGADACAMQNWAHVSSLLENSINNLPRSPPSCDVMRVRECHLSGQSKRSRQLVFLSGRESPQVVSSWARCSASVAGRARLSCGFLGGAGAPLPLEAAPATATLSFERVARLPSPRPSTAVEDADARFAHFAKTAWPRLCGAFPSGGGVSSPPPSSSPSSPPAGLLVFVPSYFDYLRVKRHLESKSVPVADMSEYVAPRDAARARTSFFARGVGSDPASAPAFSTDGARKPPVALLTERSHFFHRAVVRGVSSAFFYQLPDHAEFFAEVVSWVGRRRRERRRGKRGGDDGDDGEPSDDGAFCYVPGRAEVLFSSVDALALERVVGTERARRMLKGDEPAFCFL